MKRFTLISKKDPHETGLILNPLLKLDGNKKYVHLRRRVHFVPSTLFPIFSTNIFNR